MGDWADDMAARCVAAYRVSGTIEAMIAAELRKAERRGIERAAKVADAWSRVTGRHVAEAIRRELLTTTDDGTKKDGENQ